MSRGDVPYSFWVSQRMAIGNKLVAVSQKDMDDVGEATSVSPLSIREAGIQSLIRQRLNEDSEPAPARPCTYHTDRHSPQLKEECAAAEQFSTREGEHTRAATQAPFQPHMQPSPYTQLHTPSNSIMQQQALASSAAAEVTDGLGEERTAAGISGRHSEVQEAGCTGCQLDGMPTLLQRPQLLSCHKASADVQNAGHAEYKDGSAVVASSRVKAAAPHYALAVQSGQQQGANSRLHEQLAMPFSHLLCLWAIKLVLPHPVTQKALKLSIPDPPVFDQVRAAEARLAMQANRNMHD